MAVSLWDHINSDLNGELKKLLTQWHTKEGAGTPAIARRLSAMGYTVGQRTVWRWTKEHNIQKGEWGQ